MSARSWVPSPFAIPLFCLFDDVLELVVVRMLPQEFAELKGTLGSVTAHINIVKVFPELRDRASLLRSMSCTVIGIMLLPLFCSGGP